MVVRSRHFSRSRLILYGIVLLIVAVLVIPYVNVNRYRQNLARGLSQALGREVSVGGVSLRLLPRPGFAVHDLVIQDAPEFGAEPILRADEVTADLRVRSLWRRKVEISRLSFQYPSCNLVRNAEGKWNLAALLDRTRQAPATPTGQASRADRPHFPYIEINDGRINLKAGNEKKVYAFNNADLSLWLASEDEWRIRLEAQPVRTDANLSDTGIFRMEGSFRKASTLQQVPVDLRFNLRNTQLGQFTTLIYGRDRGWRGNLETDARIKGTPEQLALTLDATLSEFRRYDIDRRQNVRLALHCASDYIAAQREFTNIACTLPLGEGTVAANGDLVWELPPRGFNPEAGRVQLTATQVPAFVLAVLARHAKKELPDDVSAEGELNASFVWSAAGGVSGWSGKGSIEKLRFSSAALVEPLTISEVSFAAAAPANRAERLARPQMTPSANGIVFAPVAFDLNGRNPATLSGNFNRARYEFSIRGDAEIRRAAQVAGVFGLRPPPVNASGAAKLDLIVAGVWEGFTAPAISGRASVSQAVIPLNGSAQRVTLRSAELQFSPKEVQVRNLVARLPQIKDELTGNLVIERGCGQPSCLIRFNLVAGEVTLRDLQALVRPGDSGRPWYVFLGRERNEPGFFNRLRAEGMLSLRRFSLGALPLNHANVFVAWNREKLALTNFKAEALGAEHTGEWIADYSQSQPVYSGSGSLRNLSMQQVAEITKGAWATGAADAHYKLNASGLTLEQLLASADGSISFDWSRGTMRLITLPGGDPLEFRRFEGSVTVKNGRVSVQTGRISAPNGIYQVSGTASLNRTLDLTLVRNDAQRLNVTGTLDAPRVRLIQEPATAQISLAQ